MTGIEQEDPALAAGRRPPVAALVVVVGALLVVGVVVGLLAVLRSQESYAPETEADRLARAACDRVVAAPVRTDGLSPEQVRDLLRVAEKDFASAAALVGRAAVLDPGWAGLDDQIGVVAELVADYVDVVSDDTTVGDVAAIAALRERGLATYTGLVSRCRTGLQGDER